MKTKDSSRLSWGSCDLPLLQGPYLTKVTSLHLVGPGSPGTLRFQGRRLFPGLLMPKFSELLCLIPSSFHLERIKIILPLNLILNLFLFNRAPQVWPTSRTQIIFLMSCLLLSESLPCSQGLDIIICLGAVLHRTPGDQIQGRLLGCSRHLFWKWR